MMDADWKRLDRHGLSSEPGQPVLMAATIDKLDEYADRITELEAKLAKAVEALTVIANYRKQCLEYDTDVGLEPRTFDVEDVRLMEWQAKATLAELTGGKDE